MLYAQSVIASAMMLPVNLHELLGIGMRAARLEHGWRQQDASNEYRAAGLVTWTPLAVGQVENGTRKPALGDYLLACTALGVSLADLVPDVDELVDLGTGATMTASAIRLIMSGVSADNVPDSDITTPGDKWMEAALRPSHPLEQQLLPIWASAGRPLGQDDFRDPLLPPTEAEQRAADRLGILPAQLKAASRVIWRRSFEDERDARAGNGDAATQSLQARRGHASRAMLAELGDYLRALGIPSGPGKGGRTGGE